MEKVSQLGPYRIDDELAHSNICTVYRGFETSLGRPVLIKKLHPQMAREDDIRNRFEREAQVCAQVKHENIVDIYGYYAEPEQTMLVLEFVDGPSLAEIIATNEPIPWRSVLAILHGIFKGLAYAHSKSAIHRDIKPDNILISKEGEVKISDFGLATIEDAPRLTRQGMVVGTPAYMPPEQITGSTIDQRSDLFSLGATIYELLTGTSPFFADSFSEIMKKVLHAHPQKPSVIVPDIPTEFDQIIMRLIEKQPTKRYATAEQALHDVRRLAEQKDVPLHAEAVREFLKNTQLTDTDKKRNSTSIPTPAPLKRPSYTWLYGLAGVSAVVIVLLVSGVLKHQEQIAPELNSSSPDQIVKEESLIEETVSREHETASKPSDIIPVPHRTREDNIQNRENLTTHDQTALAPDVTSVRKSIPTAPLDTVAGKEVQEEPEDDDVNLSLPGRLIISTNPWAMVTIDNETIGNTPLTEAVELPAGEHQIVFDNDQFPSPVVEKITIEPGGEAKIDINLWSYFTVIRMLSVKPWAEIFIDNVSYGETPRAKPIILPTGRHEIELRNPQYKTWFKTVEVRRGDPPVDISVTLEPLVSVDLKQ